MRLLTIFKLTITLTFGWVIWNIVVFFFRSTTLAWFVTEFVVLFLMTWKLKRSLTITVVTACVYLFPRYKEISFLILAYLFFRYIEKRYKDDYD